MNIALTKAKELLNMYYDSGKATTQKEAVALAKENLLEAMCEIINTMHDEGITKHHSKGTATIDIQLIAQSTVALKFAADVTKHLKTLL